jgi:hypothetical protein
MKYTYRDYTLHQKTEAAKNDNKFKLIIQTIEIRN